MEHKEKLDRLFDRLYAEGYPFAAGYLEHMVRTHLREADLNRYIKETERPNAN